MATIKKLLAAVGLLMGLGVQPLFACAACYGQSDSALAKGMNMAIFFLLAVIVGVLSGVVVFFVHVGRKSSSLDDSGKPEEHSETEK